MTDTNGGKRFEQKELLYEERFATNERQHQQILAQLTKLTEAVGDIRVNDRVRSALWGTVGAGALFTLTYLAPLLIGGCQ